MNFQKLKSFKGNINEIIKQYKELVDKKIDFDNLVKINRFELKIKNHKCELEISILKEEYRHEEEMLKIECCYLEKQADINLNIERYKELEDIKNNIGNISKLEEIKLQIENKEKELKQIQEKENMESNQPLENEKIQSESVQEQLKHEQYMLKLPKESEISKLNKELKQLKRRYHIREEFEKESEEVIKR